MQHAGTGTGEHGCRHYGVGTGTGHSIFRVELQDNGTYKVEQTGSGRPPAEIQAIKERGHGDGRK